MEGRLIESDADRDFGRIIGRLKKGKKDLNVTVLKGHRCSHEECNPQNEEHMVYAGSLEGPPLSSNIFLCKYGNVHICSASSCDLYAYSKSQTCPLSGYQWGLAVCSYDKNDYRTWKRGGHVETSSREHVALKLHNVLLFEDKDENEKCKEKEDPLTKKKRVQELLVPPTKKRNTGSSSMVPLSKTGVLERSGDLITILLFSNCRRACNLEALSNFKREAEKAKQTYINRRTEHRQLPYLTDILRLVGHYLSQPLPLIEMEPDEALKNHYAHIIWQVWQNIVEYTERIQEPDGTLVVPRLDFDMVALGTLYCMREGLQCDGVYVLPSDAFLMNMLPLVRDLDYFNIKKKKITRGAHFIENTYKRAIRLYNVLPEQLILDVTTLPPKDLPTVFTKLG